MCFSSASPRKRSSGEAHSLEKHGDFAFRPSYLAGFDCRKILNWVFMSMLSSGEGLQEPALLDIVQIGRLIFAPDKGKLRCRRRKLHSFGKVSRPCKEEHARDAGQRKSCGDCRSFLILCADAILCGLMRVDCVKDVDSQACSCEVVSLSKMFLQ